MLTNKQHGGILVSEVIDMAKLITDCPACGHELTVKTLQCSNCGLELSNDFELNIFDRLDTEQYSFLLTFLKHRGNLKLLQEELNLSYPSAKKKLTEVLTVLNLSCDEDNITQEENPEMSKWFTNTESNKASDIIKAKLAENGGRAVVSSISGNRYGIIAHPDGKHILCDELPPIYTYDVFDVIVDLLKSQPNGKARKGNARNYRLGEAGCEEDTVAGAILKNYYGKNPGESGIDPVFVLASVLEWADIAHNGRGYLELTASYRRRL